MKIKDFLLKHMLAHFTELCQTELELDRIPQIEFVDAPYLSGGGKKSFGVFDGIAIKVVITGRHPMDIMRTLAHELTHWKQKTSNMQMDGSDGSDDENQANAIAGIIMRKFAEEYPDYFIDSLPN